jgi:hypothetical protein
MEKYQIIGDEIVEGIPYSIPNNFPKGDPTVIGFEVNQLNFGPPQWELRLFPGGEWHGRRPHFSSRSQNRAQRSGAELWVIGPMLPLMVVDCSMSIRIVEVIGRRVHVIPSYEEAAFVVVPRATTTTFPFATAPLAAHSKDADAERVLAVQVTPSIDEFATFVLEDIPIKAVKSKSSMLVLSLAIIAAI